MVELGPSCWREDCDQPRLRYGHACLDHDPLAAAPAAPRCQLPLRCYCPATPKCLGHPDNRLGWQKPQPESIEAAKAAARAARQLHVVK